MRVALATSAVLPRPDADLPILVDAFRRAGVDATVVVWDDPAVVWRSFDAVVVRSTWDYLAKLDAFVRWIDSTSRVTRLVNSAATLRWNLDKRYLFDLAAQGVDIISTTLVERGSMADWPALFGRHGELVLKPAISAGSFATVRIAAGDRAAAERHIDEHAGRDFLVQPLVPSVVARGETNIVCFGGRPTLAVRKGARWSGDLEQSRGLVEPTEAELSLVERALGAVSSLGLGTPAYARVDIASGDDGRPLLMELELLEPSLFLDRLPGAADDLVRCVAARAQ